MADSNGTNGTTPVAETVTGAVAETAGANGAAATGVINGVAEGIGLVRPTDIIREMEGAYLDYAMSVIVARALPDVRDGLKPVHRRILYAMHSDLGLHHDKPHKKSARIVGEVLGKYHPHGDTAVYDAMVRMAQDFSLRYPLIDGQGNFGSIDGDNAAAMRYTEARLAEIANLMLADLEKDTVDWHDNFDNSLLEPDILPAALPNLLINGSSGIAVGMATNIPPHNLGEVVDALAFVIDNYARIDEITVEHLTQFIQGPDFPTGGILYRYRADDKGDENLDAVAQGYSVGKSRLIVQAKAHFEEMSRGRMRIVVTELPYQTNKVALLERIAALARDGKIEGITDLRDESDRTGMRISIELARTVEPKHVLSELFKLTPLQQTFGMQMLALVDGEPRTLSLKRILHLFVQHRQEIIRRRSEYELGRARQRIHIVEGLLRALDILDEVIDTIRRSQSADTARTNLVRNFSFTEIQAQAILDMQLRRLAALERKKLQDEFKELQKQIAYLEDLLAHPEKMLAVIKSDLLEIKEKYADARRTQIVDRTKGTLTTTDLLPDQEVWISVGASGDLRRQDVAKPSPATLRQIGKGSEVELLTANTRDFLYLFATDGRCRRVSIHEIPFGGQAKHMSELSTFTRRDTLAAALALPRDLRADAEGYLFLATEQGMVKRVTLADFLSSTAGEPSVMNVDGKDRLGWVLPTRGGQEIMLVTERGQSIRFSEEDVRSMGLPAGGVGGIKLGKRDKVIYAGVVDPQGELLTMTAHGYAKRSPLSEFSSQGRNGGGIIAHKTSDRTGAIVAARLFAPGASGGLVVLLARGGPEIVALEEVPSMGRSAQGKQLVEATATKPVVTLKSLEERLEIAEAETPSSVQAALIDLPPATETEEQEAEKQDKAKEQSKTEKKAESEKKAKAKKPDAKADKAAAKQPEEPAKAAPKRPAAPKRSATKPVDGEHVPLKPAPSSSAASRSTSRNRAEKQAATEAEKPSAEAKQPTEAKQPSKAKPSRAARAETKTKPAQAKPTGSKPTGSKPTETRPAARSSAPKRQASSSTPSAPAATERKPKASASNGTGTRKAAPPPEKPAPAPSKPSRGKEQAKGKATEAKPSAKSSGASNGASNGAGARKSSAPARPTSRAARTSAKLSTVTSVKRRKK